MKPERDFSDYVRDMLDMAEAAYAFVADMDYDEFLGDLKTQLAVTRALEVMGEAANHIPADQRLHYPDIDWRGMVGMRNWLVHAYFATQLDIVWETVQQQIPQLLPSLRQMLRDASPNE